MPMAWRAEFYTVLHSQVSFPSELPSFAIMARVYAGKLRRAEAAAARLADASGASDSLSPHNEARLLVQAVRGSKLPALIAEDALLFTELIGDVWPAVRVSNADDSILQEALRAAAAFQHLVDEPEQVCLSRTCVYARNSCLLHIVHVLPCHP